MRALFTAALAAALLAACGGQDQQPAPSASKQLSSGTMSRSGALVANDYHDLVQRMYVAYFGRPADAGGLVYFANLLAAAKAPATAAEFAKAALADRNLLAILDVFSTSQESRDMYAGDTSLFLDAVYQNLFNRAPDEAGKAFWTAQLEAGTMSRSTAAVQIMSGAQSADAGMIANKVRFAAGFTASLNDPAKVAAYSGLEASAVVRGLLSKVNATTSSSGFQATIDTALSGLLGQKAILYGMVAVGPVANATVRAYAASGAGKGSLLGTATTDAQGMYYLFVPPQQAPVIIEASGGNYRDPASGIDQTLAVDLRSVVPSATGMTVASVTVYSDAVAGIAAGSSGGYTTTNVINATARVSTQLPAHPIALLPIDTSKRSQVGWTQQRLAYGTLNGAASQYLIEKPEAELRTVVSTFGSALASGTFMVEPNIAIAMNNYGANPDNVTGYGAPTFAAATIDNRCFGKIAGEMITYCPQKPQLKCTAPRVPVNGQCMVPNALPVDPNAKLAKTWRGPWQWKGRTAGPGCLVDDSGDMTMTVRQDGKDITGTVSVTGLQSADSNCKITSGASGSGTIKGTLVDGKVVLGLEVRGPNSTLSFSGLGSMTNGVFSGTIKRTTGGSGFFNLH